MILLLAENVKPDIISTSSNSIWKLLGLILLCAVIIVACYYTTRFIGRKSQGIQGGGSGKNIRALETFRVTQNKYLQLIKCGDKYLLISVTKDNISLVSEIDGESLLTESASGNHKSFKEIISSFSGKGKNEKKSISEFADINVEDKETEPADMSVTAKDPENAGMSVEDKETEAASMRVTEKVADGAGSEVTETALGAEDPRDAE
jgi:flagellar protein FliO/FliZ